MKYIKIRNRFLKFKRSLLRKTLRGAIKLQGQKEKNSISELSHIVKNYQLKKKQSFSSDYFFGRANINAEMVTRQFLITRFIQNQKFNDATFRYEVSQNNFFLYGIPIEWQKLLFPENNKIGFFVSTLFWYIKVTLYLFNGIVFILKAIFLSLLNILKSNHLNTKNFVYFQDLSKAGFPFFYDIYSQKNIPLHKYLSINENLENINILYGPLHNKIILDNKKLKYKKNTLIYFDDFKKIFRFLLWSFISISGAIKDLIIEGDWVRAVMLKEASHASAFRFSDTKAMANSYYFNNNSSFYRPLWTYEAEKKGSKILFYFYSSGIEPYKKSFSDRDNFTHAFYEIMTWSNYLVWDEGQAKFLSETINISAEIKIIGPIFFKNNNLKQETFKNIALIFDIQPFRYSFVKLLGIDFYYMNYKTNKAFLEDCMEAVNETNLTLALKRKRDIYSLVHKGYAMLIKKLKVNGLKEIDSDIFTLELIKKSSMVISLPFTSTSRIAKILGVPTIYYDPTGKIFKNDPASRGIKVVNNIKDLNKWVFQNSNKKLN